MKKITIKKRMTFEMLGPKEQLAIKKWLFWELVVELSATTERINLNNGCILDKDVLSDTIKSNIISKLENKRIDDIGFDFEFNIENFASWIFDELKKIENEFIWIKLESIELTNEEENLRCIIKDIV
jgi:6-pyruvoyl-tetrahydropterin synthase